MILLVHSDLGKIKDFIMWADVEFAMQLELLETRRFDTQEVGIIDLGGLDSLGGIDASEPLYIICHGGSGSPVTTLDGEHYRWDSLGAAVGRKLSGDCKSIVLFACYAADGSVGSRPIDVFVKGLGKHRSNVCVTAYQGATITNTMATVTARDSKNLGYHPILVADELRMKDAGTLDDSLRNTHQPQLKFDSYLKANPKASNRAKAINAANISESFYVAFGKDMASDDKIYAVSNNKGQPVALTS